MSRQWTEARRRVCGYCGHTFYAIRADRETCSRACGVKLGNLTRGREVQGGVDRRYVPGDLSAAAIDARFEAALREIQRRRRTTSEVTTETAWAQRPGSSLPELATRESVGW